jgi:hypothetical protein
MVVSAYEYARVSAELVSAMNRVYGQSLAFELDWFGRPAALSFGLSDFSDPPADCVYQVSVQSANFYVSGVVPHELGSVRDLLQGFNLHDLEPDLRAAVIELGCEPLLAQLRPVGEMKIDTESKPPIGLHWLTYTIFDPVDFSRIASGIVGADVESLQWLAQRLVSAGRANRVLRSFRVPIDVIAAEVNLSQEQAHSLDVGDLVMLDTDGESEKTHCLIRTECGGYYAGLISADDSLEVRAEQVSQGEMRQPIAGMDVAEISLGTGIVTTNPARFSDFYATWRRYPGGDVVLRFAEACEPIGNGYRNIAFGKLVRIRSRAALLVERRCAPE